MLHRGIVREIDAQPGDVLQAINTRSPLRQRKTSGGLTMTVATTSCGPLGWVSCAQGYRHAALDPNTNRPWPVMPMCFLALAQHPAATGAPLRALAHSGAKPATCRLKAPANHQALGGRCKTQILLPLGSRK